MTVSFIRVPAGWDLGPMLVGLPDDLCQCPHWGYVLRGRLKLSDQGRRRGLRGGSGLLLVAGACADGARRLRVRGVLADYGVQRAHRSRQGAFGLRLAASRSIPASRGRKHGPPRRGQAPNRIPAYDRSACRGRSGRRRAALASASAVVAAIVLTILMPDDLRLGPDWLLPGIVGRAARRSHRRRSGEDRPPLGPVPGAFRRADLRARLERPLGDSPPDVTSDQRREGRLTRPTRCWKRARSSGYRTSSRSRSSTGSWTAAERRSGPIAVFRNGRLRVPAADEPLPRAGRLAPPFIDYLYLGFTNATAFSPTDAMPLAPWAKITMALQALISLVVLGLVISRAVNVFA